MSRVEFSPSYPVTQKWKELVLMQGVLYRPKNGEPDSETGRSMGHLAEFSV
jgi:hypothetical protein